MSPSQNQGQVSADPLDHIKTSTTPARLARVMGIAVPEARSLLNQLSEAGKLTRVGDEYSRQPERSARLIALSRAARLSLEEAADKAVLAALEQADRFGEEASALDISCSTGLRLAEIGEALDRLEEAGKVQCDRHGFWSVRDAEEDQQAAEQLWSARLRQRVQQ